MFSFFSLHLKNKTQMPGTEVFYSLAKEKPSPQFSSPGVALKGSILSGTDLPIPRAPAKSVELTLEKAAVYEKEKEKAAIYTEDYPSYTAQ